MCEASIHVPHRRANTQERLTVQQLPGIPSMFGLYPADPGQSGDTKLVCTRGHTKAVIKRVQLNFGCNPRVAAYANKRNVEVVLFRRYHHDIARFPDGTEASMSCFVPGMRIDIGIPVKPRKPKGMRVIEGAVREAIVLNDPDPKEGEAQEGEQKPTEPAPAPQPAHPTGPAPQEPEQAPAVTARRRRKVTA